MRDAASDGISGVIEVAIPADRRVLIGEEPGAATRRELGLDALDRQPALVRVRIDTDGVTSSFLRGLFAPSVLSLGLDGFFAKYQLAASSPVREIMRANAEFVAQTYPRPQAAAGERRAKVA